MAKKYTIKDMLDELQKCPTQDYFKYQKKVIDNLKKDINSPLTDYIGMIIRDAILWFDSFPESITAKTTFGKVKSSMLFALNNNDIQQGVGIELCKNAKLAIETAWKSNDVQQIISSRSRTDEDTVDNDNDNEKKNMYLKQVIVELVKKDECLLRAFEILLERW